MAFSYDNTETVDPAAQRNYLSAEGSSTISTGLLMTGSYDAATLPAAASDPIIGVAREDIAAGKRGRGAIRGLFPVVAGTGGWTKGARLMPEAATGKAIAWTASTGANATIIGIAQTTTAANATGLAELNLTGALGQG